LARPSLTKSGSFTLPLFSWLLPIDDACKARAPVGPWGFSGFLEVSWDFLGFQDQ
jgi:hypothetical protein